MKLALFVFLLDPVVIDLTLRVDDCRERLIGSVPEPFGIPCEAVPDSFAGHISSSFDDWLFTFGSFSLSPDNSVILDAFYVSIDNFGVTILEHFADADLQIINLPNSFPDSWVVREWSAPEDEMPLIAGSGITTSQYHNWQEVPEPSGLLLMVIGLGGVLWLKRR